MLGNEVFYRAMNIRSEFHTAISRPRFSAKLALTPVVNPYSTQMNKDVFLVDPEQQESPMASPALVFPGPELTSRQKLATMVSFPEQEVMEKGQLLELETPDPDSPDETVKTKFFFSGEELSLQLRRERAKLLQQLSAESDTALGFQDAGDFDNAFLIYCKAIELSNANKPPANKALERDSIFIPSAASANLHYQAAKVMWAKHPHHWRTVSSIESAVRKDTEEPKYKAFQKLFQHPFTEEMHQAARQDKDFNEAVQHFAQNRPEKALISVNKALQNNSPGSPLIKAFQDYLTVHEIVPDFPF